MAQPLQIATTNTPDGRPCYSYERVAYSYELERCRIEPSEWLVWVTDKRRRPPHHRTLSRKTARDMGKVKHYRAFLELLELPTTAAH